MKTKQFITIVVVCVLVFFTGISGVISAGIMTKIETENQKKAAETVGEVLSVLNSTDNISLPENDFIGRINVIGTIQGSQTAGFSAQSDVYNHTRSMEFVDKMIESENNKGILLYVDSPGGTVYHSDEMYLKLMEYKEKTGRPIYAYFASEACSGGYYISMAADHIYANRNTWTGSIGVVISLLNYKELADKLGVKFDYIVSGDNKSMGAATEELTDEQREILQSLVDEAYDQFTDIVASGRNMSKSKVIDLADGRLYSAKQALDNGLVDEILGFEDVKKDVCDKMDAKEIYTPETSGGVMRYLYGLTSNIKKSSDSDIRAFEDLLENDKSGVLYYAR